MGKTGPMDWSPLAGLAEPDRRAVLRAGRRHRFTRGEAIFHEDDPGASLHLLTSGRVAVQVTTDYGDVATVKVIGTGGAFGELALLSPDHNRSATVTALEATETHSISREDFTRLRRQHPPVEQLLTQMLAEEVRRLDARLLEALHTPVERRVLRRLVELAREYHNPAGLTVIPLRQDVLASMAGASRPTTNQILKAAEQNNLIGLGRTKITIHNLEALTRQAH